MDPRERKERIRYQPARPTAEAFRATVDFREAAARAANEERNKPVVLSSSRAAWKTRAKTPRTQAPISLMPTSSRMPAVPWAEMRWILVALIPILILFTVFSNDPEPTTVSHPAISTGLVDIRTIAAEELVLEPPASTTNRPSKDTRPKSTKRSPSKKRRARPRRPRRPIPPVIAPPAQAVPPAQVSPPPAAPPVKARPKQGPPPIIYKPSQPPITVTP